jgi:hypothetical protein
LLNVIHINGQYPNLEAKLLKTWQQFCVKNPPLPFLEKLTLHERISESQKYWDTNVKGNLVFYRKNATGFAVFGFGTKWLETKNKISSKNPATLIIGATLNSSLKEVFESIKLLKKAIKTLKTEYLVSDVFWNVNRKRGKKSLEKLLSSVGENKGEYWQAL